MQIANNTHTRITRKGVPCPFPAQIAVEIVNRFDDDNISFMTCLGENYLFTVASLLKYCLLTMLIFLGLAKINNAVADTPSANDQCATFVPIRVSNLTTLCKNRAIDNIDEYRFTVLSGKWEIRMKYCERDLIKYLTYKFLSPHHAKEFNENFDKAMELHSEIIRQFYCGDSIGCGSNEGVVISSYLLRSVRIILYAVVEEINERKIRQTLCNRETMVTHPSGQNDDQDCKTTRTDSPRKVICYDDIMTLCREESEKKQGRFHAENTTYNKEEYIKCLMNYISKSIYTEHPIVSLKFKKKLGNRVKELNCKLSNMFTELYCNSDKSPCKTVTDSRATENIEKISEQLIELPFMYDEECQVSYDLPPDERLDDAVIQEFWKDIDQLSTSCTTIDHPISFSLKPSWRMK